MNRVFMTRTLCSLAAAAALAGSLSACTPLVVGGAVVMGSLAVSDRRTVGTQVEDEGIELTARRHINAAVSENARVSVTSFNRQVLLTGEVTTAQERERAERIANGVENVRSVVNDLAVMPAVSFSQRSSDTLITTRIRASLLDAKDLPSNVFKVVTDRNTVYLMGRVTEREARRATEIARGTNDVRKVVRLFEIVPEQDLQRGTQPSPAPAAPAPAPAG